MPNPQNLRRIDRVRLKDKTKLVDEVIDSVHISNITIDDKLLKCEILVVIQLFGIKEIKKQERKTILEKKNLVKHKCTFQKC